MAKNLLAIAAYPVVFWLAYSSEALFTSLFRIYRLPALVSLLTLLFPFVISPIVCGLIARAKPALMAVLGSLLHIALVVIFAPFFADVIFYFMQAGNPPPEISALLPARNDPRLVLGLVVLSVVFLPIIAVLAALSGYFGAKLKRKPPPA